MLGTQWLNPGAHNPERVTSTLRLCNIMLNLNFSHFFRATLGSFWLKITIYCLPYKLTSKLRKNSDRCDLFSQRIDNPNFRHVYCVACWWSDDFMEMTISTNQVARIFITNVVQDIWRLRSTWLPKHLNDFNALFYLVFFQLIVFRVSHFELYND